MDNLYQYTLNIRELLHTQLLPPSEKNAILTKIIMIFGCFQYQTFQKYVIKCHIAFLIFDVVPLGMSHLNHIGCIFSDCEMDNALFKNYIFLHFG